MFLKSKSKTAGVVLSYLSLTIQTISTLILTRFYLLRLGTDTYGLYQMIYSVAHYILILDLGISITLVRYITEFDARDDHEQSENFAFHFMLVVLGIIVVIAVIGGCLNGCLERIYTSLTSDEYNLAHKMFTTMVFQIEFTVVSHYFRGIALAHEQFAFTRVLSIIQIIFNTCLVFFLINLGMGVMGIVMANTVTIVIAVIVYIVYDFCVLKFRMKFHFWNFRMLMPAAALMLAMLLQSVVSHVNNSVDKTILGIMLTKTDVAVYSIAATFITMFNSIPTAISSVFQPKATKMVVKGTTSSEMTDFVVVPGRFQFMLVGGFIAGFLLLGRDFILCWTGKEEMLNAWQYVLIIMVPNSIPLVQNTTLSILNALDKRLFRSLVLALLTLLNIGLTVVFINLWGPIGAPLGTGISYFIGHILIMNIYYSKVIGLEIFRMFSCIFKKIWICILGVIFICLPLVLWNHPGSWIVFIIKAICFCCVYGFLLYFVGFNGNEKKRIMKILNCIGKQKKENA